MANEKDILKILDHELNSMSKGNRQIAMYILSNYDKAAYMTAAKLADAVGVSESTVVRFACTFGYDGYPAFQENLQELLKSKLTWGQRLYLEHANSPEETIRQAMKADLKSLVKLSEELDITNMKKLCSAILNARRVYILGIRSSAALAQFLYYYLNYIRENVYLVTTTYGDVYSSLMYAEKGDLVIGVSFPRYSKTTVEGMKFAKSRNASTVAITDTEDSPLAAIADTTVFAKSGMNSFVDSFVAPMSIINAIIVMVGLEHRDTLLANFECMEEIWKQNNVYTGKFEDEK